MPILNATAALEAYVSPYLDIADPEKVTVYTEVDEIPAIEINPNDYGDDAILGKFPEHHLPEDNPEEAHIKLELQAELHRIAILHRSTKFGDVGPDVFALKRALAKAGYGHGISFRKSLRYKYGKAVRKQVSRFQQNHGLHVDGQYGPQTHKKLARYFDSYGCLLLAHAPKHPARTQAYIRQVMMGISIFCVNHNWSIYYTQGPSRMYGVRNKIRPPRITRWEDCSSICTYYSWYAGIPDPNGLHYDGRGYTGTFGNHGRRTGTPAPADFGFYGWEPYHHMVMYIGGNRAVSHGNNAGPHVINPYYSGFHEWRTGYIS